MNRKQKIIEFLQRDFPQFVFDVEDVGDRGSTLRYQVNSDGLRPGNTVAGPTLFGIADAALYVAILGEIGIVPLAVTTSMNINFLRRPSPDRDVVGQCRLLKLGKRLAVGEVNLFSEGDTDAIAHAVGTYALPPENSETSIA